MTKKLFLTSILTMCMIAPAIADPAQPGDTVDSSTMCTVEGIGIDEGTALMEAIWTPNTYSENPGYYLSFENGTLTQHVICPANSWCPGFTDQPFADASMIITSCATTDANYPYSAQGTASYLYCYNTGTLTCSTQNALTVAHGTVTYANSTATTKSYSFHGIIQDNTLACAATVTCDTGYTATAKGALADYVNVQTFYDDDHIRYRSHDGTNTNGNQTGLSAGSWEITLPDGTKISGTSSVNTTAGDSTNLFASGGIYNVKPGNIQPSGTFNSNSSGNYCWCNMTGYTLAGTNNPVNVSSLTPWVFVGENDARGCVHYCATSVQGSYTFRKAVFGSYGEYPTCNANTINLNWYNDTVANNGTIITPTNTEANQCTYDGSITLPSNTMSKTGYTFSGWRLREQPSNNNNNNNEPND